MLRTLLAFGMAEVCILYNDLLQIFVIGDHVWHLYHIRCQTGCYACIKMVPKHPLFTDVHEGTPKWKTLKCSLYMIVKSLCARIIIKATWVNIKKGQDIRQLSPFKPFEYQTSRVFRFPIVIGWH